MEAKELRIGNLVEFDNRIFEIHTLSEVFPTLNTSEFGIGVVDWNNIKPILLTEEWLLKFSFEERIESENFSKWFSLEDNPVTHDVMLVVKQFKDENRFFFQNGYHNIFFVHQLQNLYYALTGEELIIKNQE